MKVDTMIDWYIVLMCWQFSFSVMIDCWGTSTLSNCQRSEPAQYFTAVSQDVLYWTFVKLVWSLPPIRILILLGGYYQYLPPVCVNLFFFNGQAGQKSRKESTNENTNENMDSFDMF